VSVNSVEHRARKAQEAKFTVLMAVETLQGLLDRIPAEPQDSDLFWINQARLRADQVVHNINHFRKDYEV
jgi:hypothetical protein